MNKKIFTLLASSLMLFMAVFSTKAQSSHWVGDTVKYLPEGIGKGAYHLLVTYKGMSNPYVGGSATGEVLYMDSTGFVGLMDSTDLHLDYTNLRKAMWCVNVQDEALGQVPSYTFTNKEYSADFGVIDQKSTFTRDFCPSFAPASTGFDQVLRQVILYSTGRGNDGNKVYSAGDLTQWWFSRTYNTSPLETNQFLRIQIEGERDYYLTLANASGLSGDSLVLVKAHKNDFNPGSDLYDNHLVFFTLVNAAPRVLVASEFNTKLHEANEGFVTLKWSPNVSANQVNVFSQPLKAKDVTSTTRGSKGHYLYLYTESNKYLYVDDTYYSDLGRHYPIIKDDATSTSNTALTDQFRIIYYPSEDSVVINARQAVHENGHGRITDPGAGNSGYDLGYDLLNNWETWNYLTVRMQDLGSGSSDRVITVYTEPANTRAYFDINKCESVDPNRTTLEPNLYTVRDTKGRYLIVPLEKGTFTPKWQHMSVDSYDGANDTIEKVLKTPSYQWFVTKVHEDSETSRIYLTNREFDNIRLEYVQVYKTAERFFAYWSFTTDSLNPGADYQIINDIADVSVDGYQVVRDDDEAAKVKADLVAKYGRDLQGDKGQEKHWVEAWMAHMPEHLMQKLYRTSPFLGYKAILPDTLNYYGYSFKFLNKAATKDWYFGVSEATNSEGSKDSTLYIAQEKTFFELNLPDTLRAYGREKFGLGHGTNSVYQNYTQTKDIAPLERYYYHFMINDYYKYQWNDNYLVLKEGQRYGYTDEATANASRLNKAKFYMRFVNEKNDREYYSLLDRIDKSNFNYLTSQFGFQITDTLKAHDSSHGGIQEKSFGVLMAYVDDLNNYVKSVVKVGTDNTVSTFALGQMQDELYRRFNTDLEECGRGEDGDEPRTLKFYRWRNPVDYLMEDQHSATVPPYPATGINFLGFESVNDCDPAKGQWHNSHNYAIYVDTAYVNRGTGHIKPQYLLVMDPKIDEGGSGCNQCGDSIDFRPYVYGRYLRNQTDSARVGGTPGGTILNSLYLRDGGWERFSFTEAIHVGDSLYILNGTKLSDLYSEDRDGKQYVNFLRADKFPNIKIVNLANNFHKDEVFSMRFIERQRDNDGNKIEGASKVFLIESETTNRDITKGRMIAPTQGGWVKREKLVPTIGRGSYQDAIKESELFDVECASVDELPTSTDEVSTVKVTVVSGNGDISILNAAGKKAVVTNVLGQTIAQEVLTSDHVTIQAPKGVVVVAIEGHNAIKTIVK